MPSPAPATMSGRVSHQPEVASGTSGTITPSPTTSRMKPSRMMFAGRPFARRPASSAITNMLSDSGAIDRPASSALYSSTICRYSGSTIIVPPRAICCSSCPLTPDWKSLERNRAGSISVALPRFLRLHEPPGEAGHRDDPEPDQQCDVLAALLPHQDAEHDAAHADDRQHRAAPVDDSGAGVLRVFDETDAGQHDRDDDRLERESDALRPERRDEAAEQRTDGGGDGGRSADERVHRASAAPPSKLPWMSDCMAGSRSDAPIPPMTAQKMMTPVRFCANTMAMAPTA